MIEHNNDNFDRKDKIIENLKTELRRYMDLNRDLLEKQNKLDDTNFFEIQLNERYQITTERFSNVVLILDQTKDFVKYKGTNNLIYYINKSAIILLKLNK